MVLSKNDSLLLEKYFVYNKNEITQVFKKCNFS